MTLGTPWPCHTLGDDTAITQGDILSAAPGHSSDRRMQTQALLDAHGSEGQLGQVLPGDKWGWHHVPEPHGWGSPGDISPFNVCSVPPGQELLDFLATPLLVLRVAGQVVEEPCQTTGRGVMACGDIGWVRGHWSGSPTVAPGRPSSPSNMKVSASAAMSSSDRVWPFSSCGHEMSHGPPEATSLWPNPIHSHHSSPILTTPWAPPFHWPPALWSMLPMATTVPLWPPLYAQPPLDHHLPMATVPSPPPPS